MNKRISELKDKAFDRNAWQKVVAEYQQPDALRSWWQVINSIVPYLVLWALMVLSLRVSYWLTLLLAIPAAGFMVRIFIIFHDCGHGSFFKSKRLNTIVGFITGVLTFTPYHQWRHNHAVHHATVGDLDRRGTGDVWMLTVKEYQALPRWKRLGYRLFRNPLIMFIIGPVSMFVFSQRIPVKNAGKRERNSVWWTNLALLGIILAASLTIGFKTYVLVQLPIITLGAAAGVWLFYVQHQFEGVYWARRERWDYLSAALEGSSYYKLPKVLQWFTGNIGFHHVHHVSARIPNYNLEKCHKANPQFQQANTLTLFSSFKTMFLKLWDEDRQRMIGFRELRMANSK